MKSLGTSLIVGALVGGLFGACAAAAQTISVVTTPSGSYTNSAGAAMAKLIGEKTKLRAILQAQAQAGMIPVEAGSAEFGMSNSFDITFYATGSAEYEGQGPHKNLRVVAALLPYQVALHVRADSDIKTISDLKGRRVASGFNAQKTIGRIIEAHLATAGLAYKDVVGVLTPNVNRSAEDFNAGKTDVLFFALGSAAVKQAAATVGGLRVLPIEESAAAVARMQEVLPGSYLMEVNPSAAFEGISKPTKLVAFDMVLSTNTKVPESVVYEVTRALHENKAALAATFPPFDLFEPDRMAKPVKDVPFHPGALNYYREIGIAPKS
ncbi:MAG: TAXI family TRAP transporter solute-binding subunit [Xanthobacteraceae bacterium]